MLRHSVPHFPPNSEALRAEWRNSTSRFASTPERRNKNIIVNKYFISSSGDRTHNQSILQSHFVPLRHDRDRFLGSLIIYILRIFCHYGIVESIFTHTMVVSSFFIKKMVCTYFKYFHIWQNKVCLEISFQAVYVRFFPPTL